MYARNSEYRERSGHSQTYSEVMTRMTIPDHAEIRRQRIARRRRIDGHTVLHPPVAAKRAVPAHAEGAHRRATPRPAVTEADDPADCQSAGPRGITT